MWIQHEQLVTPKVMFHCVTICSQYEKGHVSSYSEGTIGLDPFQS